MRNNVKVAAYTDIDTNFDTDATSTFRPIQRQFVWTGPRYSSLAMEYICIFLSWLIYLFFLFAAPLFRFSFLWFTSTIIVAKRA